MATPRFTIPDCAHCASRKDSLLSCVCGDELESVSAGKVCQPYKKGQIIFPEGGRPTGLHCVHQGKIKVSKVGGDNKEQIVRLAREGDVLGFRALLSETHYSASAVALEDCVVCVVPKAEFLRLIETNAQFSHSLLKLLSTALGEAEERMLHLAYKPVRERLAEALLLLLRTYQQDGQTTPVDVPISRDDLAALVGTAKETATRLLSELKADGVVSTRGSHITILQPEKLVDIATLYD
jgi:CRP/FNR family transcriptional regulator, polysaccharide utilization system transcription regulator